MECLSHFCKKNGKQYGYLGKGTIAETPLVSCNSCLEDFLNILAVLHSNALNDEKKAKIIKDIWREAYMDMSSSNKMYFRANLSQHAKASRKELFDSVREEGQKI